jgi:hypothetical protein
VTVSTIVSFLRGRWICRYIPNPIVAFGDLFCLPSKSPFQCCPAGQDVSSWCIRTTFLSRRRRPTQTVNKTFLWASARTTAAPLNNHLSPVSMVYCTRFPPIQHFDSSCCRPTARKSAYSSPVHAAFRSAVLRGLMNPTDKWEMRQEKKKLPFLWQLREVEVNQR